MTTKTLILGGTRFIGPAVVCRLRAHNCDVTLFHRGQTGTELFPELTHIIGDREQLAQYRPQFESMSLDVVIDMAPLSEAHAHRVIDTFAGIAQRIVTISSCDVYQAYGKLIGIEDGPPGELPLTETSPLRTKHFPYRGQGERYYDYEKILVERATVESEDPRGTALRLPMVYGPLDYQHRLWPYLKRMRDRRPYIVLESGQADWRVARAYVEDVAEAIALAALDDTAAGTIYNVCETECYAEREWVECIARAIQWNGGVITVDAGQCPELIDEQFNPQHHLIVSSDRIRSELSYREVVDPKEALRTTIDWELDNPPEPDPVSEADYAKEDAAVARLGVGGRDR
ncbi:MAG: NAD-dependent epimerase/dehydratase family protein [candidate division Zixibacteria bacterium]|nr:NAD-dependent epimerase/dehydratase family protein [candidate division Zixibacteria bacterium]